MGRRTSKRRCRSKVKPPSGRCSDPEQRTISKKERDAIIDDDHSCWDSLDEQALADYAENVSRSGAQEEMEMTKKLSFLNVSSAGVELPELTCSVATTSDTETTPTLLTMSSTECQRYSRKRMSKRNRKRSMKRFKGDYGTIDFVSSGCGRTRRTSLGLSKLCSITWTKPEEGSTNRTMSSSVVLTDDSQTGVGETANQVFDTSDDTSSRGLTDSDSPTLDDIIMIDRCSSSEGVIAMEGQEEITKTSTNNTSTYNPSLLPSSSSSSQLIISSTNCSQSNNESELSSTTSDSGCDGDDEESSVEITKLVQGHSTTSKSNATCTTLWSDAISSADESLNEDELQFQQILKGSFRFMSQQGKLNFSHHHRTGSESSVGGASDVFKHPQICNIQGRSGTYNKRLRKKPPSHSVVSISSPHELCKKVSEFISHDITKTELQLPMLSRSLCHMASKLAQVHQMEYLVTQQKRLLPVAAPILKRTDLTCLASKSEIDEVIRDYERELSSPVLWSTGKGTISEKVSLSVRVPLSTISKRSPPKSDLGSVVGSDAPPIHDTNIGSVMLRNMGWTPGHGLGPQEDGICTPVAASRRPKHVGLGYT